MSFKRPKSTEKIDEFRHLFENSGIHAICVSVTWFIPTYNLCELNGYKLFCADRSTHAGGAIYIQSNLKSKLIFKSSCESKIEYVFVEISTKFDQLLIGSVYRPNRCVDYSSFLSDISNFTCEYMNRTLTATS